MRKQSNIIPFTLVIIIIGLLATAVYQKIINPTVAENATVEVVDNTDKELEAIMDEESFKKAMELKALNIKIVRKKAEEIARHNTAMNEIELELEALRKREMDSSLQ